MGLGRGVGGEGVLMMGVASSTSKEVRTGALRGFGSVWDYFRAFGIISDRLGAFWEDSGIRMTTSCPKTQM